MNDLQSVYQALEQATNERIEDLETEMLKHDQVSIPVEHLFINGMYVRQIMIPAGTMLTGRVHKQDYVDVMISGSISVATPDGIKQLDGYNVLTGKAGRKRAGYAHEDTYWLTVHRTSETESEGIEHKLTVMTLDEFKALPDIERGIECQS